MLEKIRSPRDLAELSRGEIDELCGEIREKIISTVSMRGGHLSSNLGVVETTVAIHRVYDAPNDSVIFDVGHQSYTHKLLTGRYDRFDTLRTSGGISGFTNRGESEYDTVTAGHSGTALSLALGLAQANKLEGNGKHVVAVIGDGSFTNGITFEALDMCISCHDLPLVIILNDNEMSISRNVGGLSEYFSRMRSSKRYYNFKRGTESFLLKIPFIGRWIASRLKRMKDMFKNALVGNTLFDCLGIEYLGTVDGGDEARLEEVLLEAKRRRTLCIVHVLTKKGSGYELAEKHPDTYHSVSPFDIDDGMLSSSRGFSYEFGRYMTARAREDGSLCAITAAMTAGTGLYEFSKEFKERFFDVGIAEAHGAAFAAGLSLSGQKPVFAVYSTFAQRIYDQVFHDVALQNTGVVFALDRAGLVPGDGVTHQGIFDVSMFSSIPNVEIYSPESYEMLCRCMDLALLAKNPVIVRYPRGEEAKYDRSVFFGDLIKCDDESERDIVILTYGRLAHAAYTAEGLLDGAAKTIVMEKIFPIDTSEIERLCRGAKLIYVLEEGIRSGGIGEKLSSLLGERVYVHAIDGFVGHGDICDLDAALGFTPTAVACNIREIMEKRYK